MPADKLKDDLIQAKNEIENRINQTEKYIVELSEKLDKASTRRTSLLVQLAMYEKAIEDQGDSFLVKGS